MVSFDIEALYTNRPIEDALVIIKELLENDKTLSDRTPLSPKNVLDLLEFLVRTTFFIFNGTYYQQTEGVAMGGPPSSIVAEIYMQATETTALTTTSHPPKVWERHVDDVFSIIRNSNLHTSLKISTVSSPRQSLSPSSIVAEIYMQATEMTTLTTTSHPPKVWERHVDDVFSIIRNSNLPDFFENINGLQPKTKFTMETEQNSQLLFLDTFIQRNSEPSLSESTGNLRKQTST